MSLPLNFCITDIAVCTQVFAAIGDHLRALLATARQDLRPGTGSVLLGHDVQRRRLLYQRAFFGRRMESAAISNRR